MRRQVLSFRGEAPRVTPRGLPDNAAQAAINASLFTGDLRSYRQFAPTLGLANPGLVRTIYLLVDQWLSWEGDVDVARGTVAGDTTYRTYLTGPAIYSEPRFTNYALATTGAQPYPVTTRPLGVLAPDTAPTVAVDVTATEDSNVTLTNPGAQDGTTGWTTGAGLTFLNSGDIVGLNAQAGTRLFACTNLATVTSNQDVTLTPSAVLAGQSLSLKWWQTSGPNASTASMGIEFYDDTATIIGVMTSLPQMAAATTHVWEKRELVVNVPDNAVTARLIQLYTRVGAGMDAYIDNISLNTLDYSNTFDGSTLDGWDVSPTQGTPGSSSTHRRVELALAGPYFATNLDWTPYAWRLAGDGVAAWVHRDFATDQSAAVALTFKFQNATTTMNGVHVKLFANDVGAGSTLLFNRGGIQLCTSSTWDDATVVSNLGTPLLDGVVYTISMRAEKSGLAEAVVTIDITDSTGAVTVANLKTKFAVNGPRVGFVSSAGGLDGWLYITSVFIKVTAPKPLEEVASTATSYVYTFVNDLDQESAPSPASVTVLRPDGLSVTVSTPVAIPSGMSADYGISKKRIYRAATGNLGTVFRFVAEIDLTTADYIDGLTDSELGETLPSELWVLPPSDLEGIMALPNGIMAGFSKNQLCLSAQNYPHAWPIEYRLNTDTDIVGLGNIDTTVVIGTESFVYIASGNDPAAYSMSKFEVPYACVSKRSFAYLTGIGVVFAGPDGLMAVSGPGQVRNLTDPVFTREQWQALNPSSIRGVAHNDVYWMFWESGSLRGCYGLDMKQTGAGVIQMAFHASAAHVDPIEDKMYLVLDEDNEPDDVLLPEPAAPPVHIDGRTIFEFEGDPVTRMNYRWRSKLWLLEHPTWFSIFQVKAEDYNNILLRIYGDGVQVEELVIEDETEFTVTQTDLYKTLEVEVLGSSPIRVIQGAEDVKELD